MVLVIMPTSAKPVSIIFKGKNSICVFQFLLTKRGKPIGIWEYKPKLFKLILNSEARLRAYNINCNVSHLPIKGFPLCILQMCLFAIYRLHYIIIFLYLKMMTSYRRALHNVFLILWIPKPHQTF